MCSLAFFLLIWKLMKEKRYQKRNMQQFLRIIDKVNITKKMSDENCCVYVKKKMYNMSQRS